MLPALFAGGCASVTHFKGVTLNEDSVYVSGVAPVRQDKNYACGPACVAAVAALWGIDLGEFTARHPHLPADASGQELEQLAKEFGLQAVVYRGSMDDLQENLRDGRPLIVMIPQPLIANGGLAGDLVLNAWNELGPRPAHWVVVLGTIKNERVIIADPASGPLVVRRDEFQKWWAKKDHLCVLISAAAENAVTDAPPQPSTNAGTASHPADAPAPSKDLASASTPSR
jgi:predicted double-glycine peptidase